MISTRVPARTITNTIQELIGTLYLWGLVACATLSLLYLTFTHLPLIAAIILLPFSIIFGILGGFGVVIGFVALMNISQRLIKRG
jgi:hypothetical protein